MAHHVRSAEGNAGGVPPHVLDLSGAEELCTEPAPLERVRRAVARLTPGARLEVRTPITEHAFAVRAWARKQGVPLLVDERVEGGFRLVLEATETAHSTA
ncbi:MAG: sulfurtransferase TusA family protein [Candidatus Dormibacteraeota bacterium]|nr:sulfurtransferase TusA family protein [Candidatus Dormibacteraeota bacterium]